MLGCEIIEAAEEGEIIQWSAEYTEKVIKAHGFTMEDYWKDDERSDRYNASDVLIWLGY